MATTPFSPLEVEVEMRDCIEALESAIDGLASFGSAAAKANHTYRVAQAKAWMEAKANPDLKTDKLREAWVVQQTSGEMWERDTTEVAYDVQKSLVRSLQTKADLLRSLARSGRDLVDSWHGAA